ncbi:hypothetical protein DRA42_03375 [Ethanoligenens harbinense]|nr:hypothetical protein CXQ68_03370 [Ethanoligenens harbinense YUAN-3]AYF38027.1 hypothetical protein CXP51_03235 [Ethanoligenens harbinense]AYF40772.1 hypothetical protein CN246_03370 [Ethanoligenens harbinense]QCN91603.1 hypothetical protein DRA42_03375 [Ethanoligenens harbinense]
MKGIVEERAVELGEYIIAHQSTVRGAAKEFGISKSTVHAAVTKWNVLHGRSYKRIKVTQRSGGNGALQRPCRYHQS